jgi:hypothetical protein
LDVRRTKEEVGTTSVGKQLVVVVGHVAHGKDVELRFASATCDVDGEQDRESNTTAN